MGNDDSAPIRAEFLTDSAPGNVPQHCGLVRPDAGRTPAAYAAILSALRDLRPLAAGIGFGIASRWDGESGCATPDEYRLANRLAPQRRGDFLLGRRALHRALADTGLDTRDAIGFTGRRPQVPPAAVGSISHSGGFGVAIAAHRLRFRSAGIDIELSGVPLAAGRLILTDAELAWVHGGLEETAQWRLHMAFSAKEAAFKAIDPVMSGGAPRLRAIALTPSGPGFVACSAGAPPMRVHVRRVPGGVLAWTVISQDAWIRSPEGSRDSDVGLA